jgi:hypothetical protein
MLSMTDDPVRRRGLPPGRTLTTAREETMEKKRLDPDRLEVASFDAAPEAAAPGAINTYQATCHPIQTQPPAC